ncbi:MAG: ribonuclease HI [Firmicutes bacterium]|nr:ribonuclease HI [Bacillota bacterium]
MSLRPHVELYCDGACLGNPGPGGWAYLLRFRAASGVKEKEDAGFEAHTTNNRMELMGAIRGLEALSKPCEVELFCDSQYVVKGLQSWLEGWKRKAWKKANGGEVLNAELWQRLDAHVQRHRVTAHWVRGHAGHAENERVDELAREAAYRGLPKL